jgi:hypothetical protein
MNSTFGTSIVVISLAAVVFVVQQIYAFRLSSFEHHPHYFQHHHHRHGGNAIVRSRSRLHSTTESKVVNVKYPTVRGSEVDSRLFIDYKKTTGTKSSPTSSSDGSSSSSPLLALRVSHILFASKELATQTLNKLTTSTTTASEEWNFEHVAKSISNCLATRDAGGEVGWVNLNEDFSYYNIETDNNNRNKVEDGASSIEEKDSITTTTNEKNNPNQHLDLILPPPVRHYILSTPNKPGDILLTHSYRGVHLVQIVDVMVDVRKLSHVKATNKKKTLPLTVIQNVMELGVQQQQQSFTGNNELEQQLKPTTGTKLGGILGGALIDNKSNQSSPIVDLTYKIETMGCQMNLADSERIEGQLMNLGIRPLLTNETMLVPVTLNNGTMRMKSKPKEPDVVILNTCSIRDHAEQKVYSYLGPYTKRKRAG